MSALELCNAEHGYFEESTRALRLSHAVLAAWAELHPGLARIVDAHRRDDRSAERRLLKEAWWLELKRDEARKFSFAHYALMAGGAIVTHEGGSQPGVNCALFACGVHVGYSVAQSQRGAVAPFPGEDHVKASETLLKMLSSAVLDDGKSARSSSDTVSLPFWRELLPGTHAGAGTLDLPCPFRCSLILGSGSRVDRSRLPAGGFL